jgi:hypothetical protein
LTEMFQWLVQFIPCIPSFSFLFFWSHIYHFIYSPFRRDNGSKDAGTDLLSFEMEGSKENYTWFSWRKRLSLGYHCDLQKFLSSPRLRAFLTLSFSDEMRRFVMVTFPVFCLLSLISCLSTTRFSMSWLLENPCYFIFLLHHHFWDCLACLSWHTFTLLDDWCFVHHKEKRDSIRISSSHVNRPRLESSSREESFGTRFLFFICRRVYPPSRVVFILCLCDRMSVEMSVCNYLLSFCFFLFFLAIPFNIWYTSTPFSSKMFSFCHQNWLYSSLLLSWAFKLCHVKWLEVK